MGTTFVSSLQLWSKEVLLFGERPMFQKKLVMGHQNGSPSRHTKQEENK
jgi:hypothetical protein